MKLLRRTNRIYLLSTGTTLLVMLVLIFFILKTVIEEELDEQLAQKALVASHIIQNDIFPNDPFTSVEKLSGNREASEYFADTVIYNPQEGENELFRELISTVNINENVFRIKVWSSEIEWQELIMVLSVIFIAAMLLSILASYWLNKRLSHHILVPFFQNLNSLNQFSVKKPKELELRSSNIDEFQELKKALELLTAQVSKDYIALKEFTENASHEFQTPVSIIITKLDALMQHQQLTPEQAEKLESIRYAADRISRLTKDTLLLAKIENHQFSIEPNVDLASILIAQLQLFEELFEIKNFKIQPEIPEAFSISANPVLLEKMVSNLMSNAFRHNLDEGWIKIHLYTSALVIENSGTDPGVPADQLFDRFKKGQNSSKSSGLGLAIVREITIYHGWHLSYQFEHSKHSIKVTFHV